MTSHGGELLLRLFPYVITILVLVGLFEGGWPSGPARRQRRGVGPRAPGETIVYYCGEQRFALEQRSPITATPWISSVMPGAAKFDTVINALAG